MVCRFVQQHQLRRFGQQLRQRRAAAFRRRMQWRRGFRGGTSVPRPPRQGGSPSPSGRFEAAKSPSVVKVGQVRVLLHVADGDARGRWYGAAVGLDQPGHHLHQRRFARSVAADQRDAVTGLDGEGEVVENRSCRRRSARCRKAEEGVRVPWRRGRGGFDRRRRLVMIGVRMVAPRRHAWHPERYLGRRPHPGPDACAGRPFASQSLQDLGARVDQGRASR